MNKSMQAITTTTVSVLIITLVIGTPALLALGDNDKELNSLSFKIDGSYMGEPAVFQYWFNHINTEDELFRMTTTGKSEGKILLEWVVQKGNEAFYKDSENTGGTWQAVPYMENLWTKLRDPVLSERGIDFWLGIEGEEEYIIMEGESGGEEEVKLYDISVNEPIEESIFDPQ